MDRQKPPGRWSTCCCSPANTGPRMSSSPSVARSRPGAHDGRAVGVLARRVERPAAAVIEDLPDRLIGLGSPEPALDHYDQLLVAVGAR